MKKLALAALLFSIQARAVPVGTIVAGIADGGNAVAIQVDQNGQVLTTINGVTISLGDGGISFPATQTVYVDGGHTNIDGTVTVYPDGGHVKIDGVVPVSIVGSDAGPQSATFSGWTCFNFTCAASPTLFPSDAGQFETRLSSLSVSNPGVVIGPADAVDAGSGELLLGGVTDLSLPANSVASMACESLTDGGALISFCQLYP